ncbi:MAG: 50S ribosomal protein L10 [Oscillospiraceae bacterium]|nr:50S ribosomal protein L10 [Oscillospiraceae bacterium]
MPNAKVLESKKAVVEALTGKIKEATAVVFVDYKGINVAQDTALRKQFREADVEYTVVKNTLTRFAAKDCGYDFDEILNGTTAMACTTGDPIAPARIVAEFAKKNKIALSIKGGIVEGSVLSAEQLTGFSELPSKNALVASVLGTFLAPISSLAFVLDQIRIQKEEGGEAPAAAAAEEAPAVEAAAEETPAESTEA